MNVAATVGTPALWIGFTVFVLAMLALDLGVFHRRTHAIGVREALVWSAVAKTVIITMIITAMIVPSTGSENPGWENFLTEKMV